VTGRSSFVVSFQLPFHGPLKIANRPTMATMNSTSAPVAVGRHAGELKKISLAPFVAVLYLWGPACLAMGPLVYFMLRTRPRSSDPVPQAAVSRQ
jgi:hypothetical protein